MKRILYLLFTITLFTSCSSNDNELTQDHTSFVFYQPVDNDLPNCIAAHKKDGKYYKIADLGDLSKGKYTSEIVITDQNIVEIYLFADSAPTARFDVVFKLTKNKKNIFTLLEETKGIMVTDKSDPTQYPQ